MQKEMENLSFLELEQLACQNVEKWLKRTKKLIYKERKTEFEEYISKHITCTYQSDKTEAAICIMEKLADEPDIKKVTEYAKSVYKKFDDDEVVELIEPMVTVFSKRGVELYGSTHKIRPRNMFVKHIDNENQIYKANEHARKIEKAREK